MFVAILECKKIIVIPNNWVENGNSRDLTKIFYSPNENDEPDFNLPKMTFFDLTETKCYRGYVLKEYREYNFLYFFNKILIKWIANWSIINIFSNKRSSDEIRSTKTTCFTHEISKQKGQQDIKHSSNENRLHWNRGWHTTYKWSKILIIIYSIFVILIRFISILSE